MDTDIIVIHDFENINYRKDLFQNKKVLWIKCFIPNIGIILSNNFNEKKIIEIQNFFKTFPKNIDLKNYKLISKLVKIKNY